MNAFQTLPHKGKTIIVVDIANTKPEEAILTLQEAQKQIASLPARSGLLLIDATNAGFNALSANACRNFAAANVPYVRISAILGADGIRAALLQTVAKFTNHEIKPCKTRAEAMDWLIAH